MNPPVADSCKTAFGLELAPTKPKQAALVEVKPAAIKYQAPYGKCDQQASLTIQSTSPTEVTAYKINTDRHSFYTIMPRQGLLHPHDSVNIQAALLESAQEKDLPPKDKPHHLIVQALVWPKAESKFDEDVWNDLVDVKQVEVHKIVVNIQHDLKGPEKRKGRSPKAKSPRSQPTPEGRSPKAKSPRPQPTPQGRSPKAKSPRSQTPTAKPATPVGRTPKGKSPRSVPPPAALLPAVVTLESVTAKHSIDKDPHAANDPARPALVEDYQNQETPAQPVALLPPLDPNAKPVYFSPKSGMVSETKLVNIQPTKLTFQGPYGQKQKQILNLSNVTADVIGIKVRSSKAHFYNVAPAKQLIHPQAIGMVEIELSSKFDQNESKKGAHQFRIQAMQWPSGGAQFEDAVWTEQMQQKKHIQTITVHVNFV